MAVAEGGALPPPPRAGAGVPAGGVPPTAAGARRFFPRLGVLSPTAEDDTGKGTDAAAADAECAASEEVCSDGVVSAGEGRDVRGAVVSTATGAATAPAMAFLADSLVATAVARLAGCSADFLEGDLGVATAAGVPATPAGGGFTGALCAARAASPAAATATNPGAGNGAAATPAGAGAAPVPPAEAAPTPSPDRCCFLDDPLVGLLAGSRAASRVPAEAAGATRGASWGRRREPPAAAAVPGLPFAVVAGAAAGVATRPAAASAAAAAASPEDSRRTSPVGQVAASAAAAAAVDRGTARWSVQRGSMAKGRGEGGELDSRESTRKNK